MTWHAHLKATVGSLALDVELSGGDAPCVVIGPNGAGKTTLLRMIAGAHRPTSGRLAIAERLLFDTGRGIDEPPEARRVGYVPQGYGLFPHLSVTDNVAFGLAASGSRSGRRRRALALLDELECGHLAARMPHALSGGERQRVALARALSPDPAILLLDEPLAALDASARRSMRRFLGQRLHARERPAIVVTHDLRDVLALDAPVFVLECGRVVQQGTADELARAPASEYVEEFFDPSGGGAASVARP